MVLKKRYLNTDYDVSGFTEDEDKCPFCHKTTAIVVHYTTTKYDFFCVSCEEEWSVKFDNAQV